MYIGEFVKSGTRPMILCQGGDSFTLERVLSEIWGSLIWGLGRFIWGLGNIIWGLGNLVGKGEGDLYIYCCCHK